jgi:hypothetical protein
MDRTGNPSEILVVTYHYKNITAGYETKFEAETG